jgi:hypothetical protein
MQCDPRDASVGINPDMMSIRAARTNEGVKIGKCFESAPQMIANLHGPLTSMSSRTSNATVAEVRQFGPECRVRHL